MSFQYVIDNAESISISKRKKVAQTVSRSGSIKTTSVGGQVYEFRVQLPNGPRWSEYRSLIEAVEGLDRTTPTAMQINNPALAYVSEYQGDLPTPNGVTVSYTSGNTLTITGGDTLASGFKFRAGDHIQLAGGSVYTVIADVPFNSSTITVHRPIREAAGAYNIVTGQDVTWTVICVDMPNWTIFGYNQVSWSGSFVFAEVV